MIGAQGTARPTPSLFRLGRAASPLAAAMLAEGSLRISHWTQIGNEGVLRLGGERGAEGARVQGSGFRSGAKRKSAGADSTVQGFNGSGVQRFTGEGYNPVYPDE
jgi:hypothetical protein